MTPYVDLSYFALLLYPLLPAVALGLLGRLRLWYLLAATVAMVLIQYGGSFGGGAEQLRWIGAFAVYETALTLGFGSLRRRGRSSALFTVVIVLALLPLVAVKVQPLLLAHGWWPATPTPMGAVQPSGGAAVPGAQPAQPGLSAILGTTFGFLGISYLTFRYLDVLVGIHDGLFAAPGLARLLGYVFFFPCISAGPIDRYRRFEGDLAPRRSGADYAADIDAGLYRVAQGFLYKFVVAALIYRYALLPLGPQRDLLHLWLYMYVYAVFLFFDFAGYTAFAIGVSRFFGIRSPENFRLPFLSRNFKDFWNRWFITLSWFLRDHVYMRFVLGALRSRRFRNRHAASYVGYMLTFLAMGFWHGLDLHYIVYGCYHGVMISTNDFLARWNQRRRLLPDNALTRGLSIVLTFNLVCFGMLIFSGHLFQ